MASTGGRREEYRKKKELDEARKAGTAAPEVDEEGNAINPHIPEYISRAPWYLGSTGPSLKHQRQQEKPKEGIAFNQWYQRGSKGVRATKYRKGACKNCGSMTHKAKDCVERPRAKGARFTNTDIAADEHVEELGDMTYAQKRDQWKGYDVARHSRLIRLHRKVEKVRKEQRSLELEESLQAQADIEQVDEDRVDKDESAQFSLKPQEGLRGARTNVRNLRIREDTAKYLMNLDVDSAYYDPKTRSMRADPNAGDTSALYHGDNMVRFTGEAAQFHEQLEQQDALQVIAAPSKTEIAFKEVVGQKDQVLKQKEDSIAQLYGESVPDVKEVDVIKDLGETETYVEYSKTGRVISGQEKEIPKSRHEEDVYPGNHTSVFGSWWDDGKWGFACCHQTVRKAYCTGIAGIEAASVSVVGLVKREREEEEKEEIVHEVKKKKKRKKQRLEGAAEVTTEEMEEYHRTRSRAEDPMKNYKDIGEV